MNYAKIKKNDIANGPGVCVSLFVQGCPHHCKGCFNKETWDFDGGKLFTWETINEIIKDINANGVLRNLNLLGGEPLAPSNRTSIVGLINEVRKIYGNSIKIYLWTGYLYENLLEEKDSNLEYIFDNVDVLIDGPFIENLKDNELELRGSSNQRIIQLKIDKK